MSMPETIQNLSDVELETQIEITKVKLRKLNDGDFNVISDVFENLRFRGSIFFASDGNLFEFWAKQKTNDSHLESAGYSLCCRNIICVGNLL